MRFSHTFVVAVAVASSAGVCACSSDDPTTPADAGAGNDAAPLPDGGAVDASAPADASAASDASATSDASRVTLLVDGVAYDVDTTKVKVDENDPTQIGYAIGEPYDLEPTAKIGQVTYLGSRGNATTAYSVSLRIPGPTKNNAYLFSTSGNVDDGSAGAATRTIHAGLTDVHVKFTASALNDGKVSHEFDVTVRDLDMK